MKVRTVLGDITPENLGVTMIHEHLAFNLSGVREDNDSILMENNDLHKELEMLYGRCNTVVEVSNRGMGRDVKALQSLARTTGLHIVCATGYYKQEFYPKDVSNYSRDGLAKIMIHEIQDGIEDSSACAGIISEIGSSYQSITPDERKVFMAACDAQKETGIPMSTHCELGTMGMEQIRIFASEGINPQRVSLGHQDLNCNLEEQLLLLKEGYFIQFDTIGKNRYRPHAERLNNLLQLLDAGFEDQIMLSTDISRQSYFRCNGGNGYAYLFDTFLPDLQESGVDPATVRKLMVENPARFLAF